MSCDTFSADNLIARTIAFLLFNCENATPIAQVKNYNLSNGGRVPFYLVRLE